MNVRVFAYVSLLLLATSSLCSFAKKNSGVVSPVTPFPPGGWPMPPGGWSMPPAPPGGWPMPPGGWSMPPGGWSMPPGQGGGGGGCSCSCNIPPPRAPKVFMVGGDKQWGFRATNYTEWALSNAPFYMDDILEFKYPEPVPGRLFNHSVYVLKNWDSFQNCDLSGAVMIGDVFAGGEPDGFRWKLGPSNNIFPFSWDPFLYIACGEKNGLHCNFGGMKFAILPMFRGFP